MNLIKRTGDLVKLSTGQLAQLVASTWSYVVQWITNTDFNSGTYTQTQVNGTGESAYVSLEVNTDNDDDIPYTTAGNYTLSNGTKLEVDGGVGKLLSASGVNHNWPFTTPANYTLSDSTKIEISGGKSKLLGISYTPYAHWHLNESTGATASDSSGNGRDLTLQNMENADWVSGKLNNCLIFDGVNEDCEGSFGGFERSDAFTLEFWMKSTDYTTTMGVIGKQTTAGLGYLVYIVNTNQLRFILQNSASNRIYVTAAGSANDGSWHHWVVTYDGTSDSSGIHIYRDNVDLSLTVGANTLSLTIINSAPFTLSSRGGSQWFFNGYLDEIVVYDDELSASDVEYRWNSGTGIERVSYATDTPNVYPNTGKAFSAALTSFTETATKPGSTEVKYHCSSDDGVTWKYWTGAAWAVTDDSYTQANDATTVNTNVPTLATSGTFRFRALLYTDGIGTPELDNINIVSPSSYPTDDNLYIDTKDASQIAPATIYSWLTSVFTNTMPANTDIKILFSVDGRVTWLTWEITAWGVPASSTLRVNATSLTDAATNFADLPLGSGTLDVRVFLYSSDSSVTPQIDNINVTSDTGYKTTGDWESNKYDATYRAQPWDKVYFTTTAPTGTTLTVKARAGNVSGSLGSYGSALTSGEDLGISGRYIQFQVSMTSTGEPTPELNEIKVEYSQVTGTVISGA